MGRYERMICYLYEYQDGHKGANVGYVKLEKRGEQCRVLIQMRRADLATLPQAALFQQEKTGVLLIPIGVMRDNNGSMKGQYEGNVDNLAGTGLSLDDVHGVLVYVEEGHYFASTWNLEQIDARQLRWWQGDQHEDAGKAEALPEGGSETSQDMVVSSDRSSETPQNMVVSADRSSETLQNMVASADRSSETCKIWLLQRIVATRHRKTWLFHRIEAARHRKTRLLHRTAAMRHRRDLRIILPRRRQGFPGNRRTLQWNVVVGRRR